MIIRRVKEGEEDKEFEIEPELKSSSGFIFRSSSFAAPGLGIKFFDEDGNYLDIRESRTHTMGVFTYTVKYDN